jgi:hypothetical protein
VEARYQGLPLTILLLLLAHHWVHHGGCWVDGRVFRHGGRGVMRMGCRRSSMELESGLLYQRYGELACHDGV